MEDKIVEFEGTVSRCVFSSPNYKVYGMGVNKAKFPNLAYNNFGNITISGKNIFELENNVLYKIKAKEVYNNKFGTQYEVISIGADTPIEANDVNKFLSTILTNNQATVIMQQYPNIIDLVQNGREGEIDVQKLPGIGKVTLQRIISKIQQNFMLIEVCATFYNLFPLQTMIKLYEEYKSAKRIKEVLSAHPYTALTELDRVGFKTADIILQKLQDNIENEISKGESPQFQFNEDIRFSADRCRGCILYFLNDHTVNTGSTKMGVSDLKTKVKAYAPEAFSHFDDVISNENDFMYDIVGQTISEMRIYRCEQNIAKMLLTGKGASNKWNIFQKGKYVKVGDFILSDEQESVQSLLDENNIVILSGPAGSGKSSSIKALIDLLLDNHKQFVMGCPSAKASKVLSDYTKCEATTIHRMLKYGWEGFGFNENNCLPADIVILDESSMIDIFLFESVLKAIDFRRTKLLLIGDYYQIPSVGAGSIYRDIIQSKLFPVVELSKIFRYGENGILTAATDTRNNKVFLPWNLNNYYSLGGNTYMFIPQDQEGAISYTVNVYEQLLRSNDIDDVIVLTPLNKGKYGTVALNNAIQKRINTNSGGISVTIDDLQVTFKLQDIVLNTNNNYHSQICDAYGNIKHDSVTGEPMTTLIANGETGRVVYINDSGIVVKYDDDFVWIDKGSLSNLRLGYAITTHKSQGSGYKIVILLTLKAHTFFWDSALLYTGITRAKNHVIHIGSPVCVNMAVQKKAVDQRYTNLKNLLITYNKMAKDNG